MSKKRLVALLAAAAMLASSSAALAAGETELIGADTAAVVSVAEDAAPDVADVTEEAAPEDVTEYGGLFWRRKIARKK